MNINLTQNYAEKFLDKAKNLVEFTNAFGDMDEPFYNTLERNFQSAATVIAKHPGMRKKYFPVLEKLCDDTIDIGWGVHFLKY